MVLALPVLVLDELGLVVQHVPPLAHELGQAVQQRTHALWGWVQHVEMMGHEVVLTNQCQLSTAFWFGHDRGEGKMKKVCA